MLGRRSCSDNNVGEEGEGGGCCGRGSRRDVPASRGGRSAPHRRRLFSAERGPRARRDRSSSDLGLSSCGKGGGRLFWEVILQLILEMLKAKWEAMVGTTCVSKRRGWDMPRMRCGMGLGPCRHGEWHGPAKLRPEDSMSNSLSRRTSCPRRPASSTISTTSARLRRRRRRSGRAGRPARQA